MGKIFLLGIKHSGKTTAAKLLSKRTLLPYRDADDLMLALFAPLGIREWYRAHGKESFMEKEYESMRDFLRENREDAIISLGGGACDNERLMALINSVGLTVYLRRKEEDMLPMIVKDGIPPFLEGGDPAALFHELYMKRDGLYLKYAGLTIELGPYGDKEETARRIEEELGKVL